MTVPKETFRELAGLAAKRVERAIHSVTQLLDNDKQAIALLIDVATGVAGCAATGLSENTGTPLDQCFAEVLASMARQAGLGAEVREETGEG